MRGARPHGSIVAKRSNPMETLPMLETLAALPALTGDVVAPGAPEWDLARRAWNLAADQRPALVAIPADAGDVLAVMAYARAAG